MLMDIGHLHHYWVKYRHITLIIPIILLIFFSSLAIWQLRENNLKMLDLKQAVITADEQRGDVEKALKELQLYVYGHMNTRMRSSGSSEPPIQLINRYNQLVATEQARIANISNVSSDLYQRAQAECNKPEISLSVRNQCVNNYYVANGGGGSYIKLPPKELYTYDFASPRWSPDTAGVSIILAAVSLVLLIIRLVVGFIIKRKVQ